MQFSKQTWAKFAGVYSGLIFGIYWIPLRILDESGFDGIWAVALFSAISFLFIAPYVVTHRDGFIPGSFRLHINAGLSGIAFVFYASAFIYTEVVRVIILFYLMPIWGFLLARVVTGEKITGVRWLSMALGLAGLVAICGVEKGFPVPSNLGDWMALIAGIIWAGTSMSILTDRHEPVNYTIAFLFWSAVAAIIMCLIATSSGYLSPPEWGNLTDLMIWLIPFIIIIVIPAAFATMYGPSQLNPGTLGLLFMTEISVGTTTAAIFAGEPFGVKEITGVIFITLAGIAEPVYQIISKRKSVAKS